MFSNNIMKFKQLCRVNSICCKLSRQKSVAPLSVEDFPVDFERLRDPSALEAVEKNIRERKGIGNIRQVIHLKEKFDNELNIELKEKLYELLAKEVGQLPNVSHPDVEGYKETPRVLRQAKRVQPPFTAKEFSKLAKDLKLIRTEGLNALTGPKSYYFLDALADLEHALVRFVLDNLVKNKFSLVSVPDILPAEVIERCGMTVRGERSQIYFLDERHGADLCLSGTAEMALAGMLAGKTFEPSELPLRLAAVSRCYRSETSNVAEEKGIYRVHQFTKVEMFGVCAPEDSDAMLAEFLALEEAQFDALELDFQTLDMPRHELGAPAYRKHDVEAWFPGRRLFGELSSCSNCTDYQARRLQARVHGPDGVARHVHTVNGTACAVPRTVMALLETLQLKDGSIRVPHALQPILGLDEIRETRRSMDVQLKTKARR